MALEFLVNRLQALFVLLLGAFRRAMCCLRRRRRSSCDSIPLSAVGVGLNNVVNNRPETEQWDQWDENLVVVVADKPANLVQTKIEQYRQQVAKPAEPEDSEQQQNFFEDMTPKITRQTKILVKDEATEQANWDPTKFAIAPTNELGVWEDNTKSWEEETLEEFKDPLEALREQKKTERMRRMLEQQQKRIECHYRPQPLGEKIGS